MSSTFDSSFEQYLNKFTSLFRFKTAFIGTASKLKFVMLVFREESKSGGYLNIHQLYKIIKFSPVTF